MANRRPETTAELSPAQRAALLWMWPNSERRWDAGFVGMDGPTISALMALCRKGLATKRGSSGRLIHFDLTDAGRVKRQELANG